MLTAIAIDDEPIALQIVKKFADQVNFVQLDATYTNAFEGIIHLEKNPVDLLFLDVKMPDISGLDVPAKLSQPPMTIFTTAYSEHAVQSFELNAVDYLLKPFSFVRFKKACEKAKELHALKQLASNENAAMDHLFIRSGYEQLRIDFEDVLYVQSAGNYVQFVLPGAKHMSRLTMNEVEKLLPEGRFTRVHRSYIVAKKAITKFNKTHVYVGEISLPFTRLHPPSQGG